MEIPKVGSSWGPEVWRVLRCWKWKWEFGTGVVRTTRARQLGLGPGVEGLGWTGNTWGEEGGLVGLGCEVSKSERWGSRGPREGGGVGLNHGEK